MSIVLQGEIALPTNPNSMVFAVPATAALHSGWRGLQKIAWSALEAFHSASGIDAVAWFGRRVWLDRRNQPVDQLLLMFVFDGPTSSDDIALVERAVRGSVLPFSGKSMETLPPDAFPSLVVKSGKFYQLWSRIEDQPRAIRLLPVEDRFEIAVTAPEDLSPGDFLPYVRHVTFARRTIRDEDWQMERMRIAFAHHFSQRIVEADGVLHADEREFMSRVFPKDMMASMGMSDREAYRATLDDALESLPHVLGHHDKLAMIGLFFSVCHSDGKLDGREMRVLKEAAAALGIEGNEVVSYLTKLW